MIDGAKQFITNAGTDISGHVAITALTGRRRPEISNLIVENGTPGYEPASRTARWAGTRRTRGR